MSGEKRFVTISEYQRMTGMSYKTVKHAIDTGQLKAIRTEAGHFKIDTAANTDPGLAAVTRQLEDQARMLKALLSHLGVKALERAV